MQSLFPGKSLTKGKGAKEQEDQDEVIVSNSGKKSKKRRVRFGRVSNRNVKRKKVQESPDRFVAGRSDVSVDRNLGSVALNHHQVPGRGKRTVRKRPERNDEDNYRLVSRMADIVRPNSEDVEEEEEDEQTFRDINEDWASETPREMEVMTPMQVDDESDNSVGVESEDDDEGQFVVYDQRNKWGLDWNSNPNEAMEDDEEVVGVEQVEREDVAEMSESSEDDDAPANNAAANNYESGSEDYSSSDS